MTIDSLRADHVAIYGDQRVQTPVMDALAQQGARFGRAIVQMPQTNPSHASIFTGAYPAEHKLRVHGVDHISPNVSTLAETLSAAGYATAGFYSWPSLSAELSGLDRGFNTYQGVYTLAPGRENNPDLWRRWSNRADLTTNQVLDWLKGNVTTTYFLWVHYQDVHYPYTPPSPFDTMYTGDCAGCADGGWDSIDAIQNGAQLPTRDVTNIIAKYDGAVSFVDQQIGRIVEYLRQVDALDSTIVVVTADHGESFGEHGLWFHPNILYDNVLRVPLIVRYPARVPAATVVQQVVEGVDIMPTIVNLVGAKLPASVEGDSLVPLIVGNDSSANWKAVATEPDDAEMAWLDGEWKIIRHNGTGELELYNLREDPDELVNLVAANRAKAAELENDLKSWMSAHGITR